MTPNALLRHALICLVLALISAATVRLMIAVRVLDRPEARKAHAVATPKGGGVGIVVAFLVGIAALYLFAQFSRLAGPYFRGVILAATAIALVAFLDDLRNWPFTVKLAAQCIAAAVAVASGLYVTTFRLPGLGAVNLGAFGAVVAVGWILLATNAMNFIDGLNGLASGVTLIASLFLAWIAASQGGWFVYFASLLLASGTIGFLPFNFPRARIFMGDVGSQFCGFMLAVLGIAASRFERVEMSFLLVPMLLSGVLFDVVFSLVRRSLNGVAVTRPHRCHLYQLAHRSGMEARNVTLVHWGFAIFGGFVCILFVHADTDAKPLLPLLVLLPQIVWVAWLQTRVPASMWRE